MEEQIKEPTEEQVLTSDEVKYLESIEKRLNSDLQPFIRLSANLQVGFNGECDAEVSGKVERWMRETLFRTMVLRDILECNILVGWDESRSDIIIAMPPEGYKEAFEDVKQQIETYVDGLKDQGQP